MLAGAPFTPRLPLSHLHNRTRQTTGPRDRGTGCLYFSHTILIQVIKIFQQNHLPLSLVLKLEECPTGSFYLPEESLGITLNYFQNKKGIYLICVFIMLANSFRLRFEVNSRIFYTKS